MGQKFKVNSPPEGGRFQKGMSGNPSGKRKHGEETIQEATQRKLAEPVTDPSNRRERTNRHELSARRLVAQAVNGSHRAINEVCNQRKLATRHTPTVRKMSFEEARSGRSGAQLNEAFFENQAKEKSEFKRKAKERVSLADCVDRELRKRRMMDRDGTGEMVRMNMQQIIVHNLTNEYAKGDLSAIALVEKMLPKNNSWTPPVFTEVSRPSPQQAAEQESARLRERETMRENFKEFYPHEDWDNDSLLDAKIREWLKKK
jgi:hypothetical protein